jgi:hypothetical protein
VLFFKKMLLGLAPILSVGVAVEAGIRLERSNSSFFSNSGAIFDGLLGLGFIILALLLAAISVTDNIRQNRS